MADEPIPESYDGTPKSLVLPAGTFLFRLHDCSFGPTGFNPTLAPVDGVGGGRFDGTAEDPYPFLYAAGDESTAVAEALLRDLPFDDRGARFLPRAAITGRCLSRLEVARDLELVSLRSGRDLAAVAQDAWLVTAPASAYPRTRRWAHAIRRWAPWARGFAWRSLREPSGDAYVLFGDRVESDALRPSVAGTLAKGENRIDEGMGEVMLRRILEEYRVVLS